MVLEHGSKTVKEKRLRFAGYETYSPNLSDINTCTSIILIYSVTKKKTSLPKVIWQEGRVAALHTYAL